MVLWVRNLDPRMIERVAHDPVVRDEIIHKVESVVCATSEDFEHLYASPPARSDGGEYRQTVHPGPTPWIFAKSQILINVGDEFYDCADSKCEDHLGWVKVVRVTRNGYVLLRPIVRPTHRTRSGRRVDAEFKSSDDIRPEALKIAKQDKHGNLVWEWCHDAVRGAKAITQLKVHGHKIKSEYNTHVHTFTCHKCKGTYRARHCRVGFGRRLMACSKLSQIIASTDDP